MKISIIAAVARHNKSRKKVIGVNNSLPWKISEDLKNFKRLTSGHPIIMGRKTHQSIGKPLPGRFNIVISRDPNLQLSGCTTVTSIEKAIALAQAQKPAEVFIIGGAQIYQQTIKIAHRLHLTEINQEVDGDVFFPWFPPQEWRECRREKPSLAALANKPAADFDFVIYERAE